MNRSFLIILAIVTSAYASSKARSSSLDDRIGEIKGYGGLAGFCISNPTVYECKTAIGEWKPQALERIKAQSIQCFDVCPLDTYGFVYSSQGSRSFPQVSTKDFDAGAPSRGVEFRLFPVAVEILKYEGCSGCPLIKTSPLAVQALTKAGNISLPPLGYGVFYLPSAFRRLALASSSAGIEVQMSIDFGKSKEIRTVSPVAVREYAKMLEALNYHIVP